MTLLKSPYLQVLDDFGFVAGFDSGEASGVETSFLLQMRRQIVELAASESFAFRVLLLGENADTTTNGDSSVLVVT